MQPDIRFSSFLFNLQAEDEILRKYDKAPHPFVIEPPLETKEVYEQGDTLAFNLILIGRAIDYLPYFIYTFEELGRIGIGKGKGRYGLMDVYCDGKAIYSSADRQLKTIPSNNSHLSPLKLRGDESGVTPNSKLITLNFLTPTRIVVNENLVVDLEFHHLIRSLLRRISILSYFHDGKRLELDFKGVIQRAQDVIVKERDTRWYDWERYSARQETRMKMGGILGNVTFSGDLEEFMPYLLLGEHLHVGKGTSFGLGRYEIVSHL